MLPNGNTKTVRILDPLSSATYPPTAEVADFTPYACAAPPATRDTRMLRVSVAAPQDYTEPTWRRGGEILTEFRGCSRPSRHLASLTPGRDATETKRIQLGPEYPIHRLSTRQRVSHRHPTSNRTTPAKPQSTVTASYDGMMG